MKPTLLKVLTVAFLATFASPCSAAQISIKNNSRDSITVAVAYSWSTGVDWETHRGSELRGFWKVAPGAEQVLAEKTDYYGESITSVWLRIVPEGKREWNPPNRDSCVITSDNLIPNSTNYYRVTGLSQSCPRFSQEYTHFSRISQFIFSGLNEGNKYRFVKTNMRATSGHTQTFVYSTPGSTLPLVVP